MEEAQAVACKPLSVAIQEEGGVFVAAEQELEGRAVRLRVQSPFAFDASGGNGSEEEREKKRKPKPAQKPKPPQAPPKEGMFGYKN